MIQRWWRRTGNHELLRASRSCLSSTFLLHLILDADDLLGRQRKSKSVYYSRYCEHTSIFLPSLLSWMSLRLLSTRLLQNTVSVGLRPREDTKANALHLLLNVVQATFDSRLRFRGLLLQQDWTNKFVDVSIIREACKLLPEWSVWLKPIYEWTACIPFARSCSQ